MRIKKYAIGGTVTSYPAYNDMPFVNLPEAEVLGMRTGQEINRPFWYSDNTAEWEANRMDDLYRGREAYDMGYKQTPAYMDPMSMGKAESFSPITYVHPAGDLEAILQAAGYALEGDIPSAALAGSLAAASVFLPGTFQTKSTMAGGVLERSLDKSGRIHPNAIRAIIDSPQTSDVEKHVLSTALDDALRGVDDIGVLDPTTGKINYKEFKKVIGNYAPHLDASPSGEHAKTGLDRVFGKDRVDFFNDAPQEHISALSWGTGELSRMYSGNRVPDIQSRDLDQYIKKNIEWFSGMDLPRGYSDGLVRSTENIDRGRLTQFLDAVISGDDAAFEALGLPVPDFRADVLGDQTLQGWKNARDFINRKVVNAEMIGLFPSSYNPSGMPIPVSNSHLYDPGFGHFRAAYDPDAPNIAYITEIQSDAATSSGAISESLNAPRTYEYDELIENNAFEINPKQEVEEALSHPNPREYFDSKPRYNSAAMSFYVEGLYPSINAVDPISKNPLHLRGDVDLITSIRRKTKNGEKLSVDDVENLYSLQTKEQNRLSSERASLLEQLAEQLEPYYQGVIDDRPDLFRGLSAQDLARKNVLGYMDGSFSDLSMHLPEAQKISSDLIKKLNRINTEAYEAEARSRAIERLLNFDESNLSYAIYEDLSDFSLEDLQSFENVANNPVRKGLIKNYTERILQEAVSDVARRKPGIKTIRIPVGETAAKIQGHQTVRGSTKKYQSMDKTIKRVFGKKPGKVTDNNGNQWWEFDLPEGGFEKQIFNRGGKINVVKKRTGKYRIKKS
jgi:hypothetical protein